MIMNRVRQVRPECNLTQKILAQEVYVSRQTIITLEKGKYTPSLKLALQDASALDTMVEALFGWRTWNGAVRPVERTFSSECFARDFGRYIH